MIEIQKEINYFHIILMALIYFLIGHLVFFISTSLVSSYIVSLVIFLPEGFALAGVILFGRPILIGIFFGQFLLAITTSMPILPALLISLVNTGEAFIGWYLFNHFKLNKTLSSVRDVIGLLLLITLVLQPFSAFFGNAVLYYFSIVDKLEYLNSLLFWFFGNILGQFLVTPLVLLLFANYKSIRFLILIAVVVFFLLFNYFLFFLLPIKSLAILLSLTVPLIVYLAAVKNNTYSVIAVLITGLFASYATSNSYGPFATGNPVIDVINLNFYILSVVLSVLLIGTLFAERRNTEKTLFKRNEELHDLVQLREQVERMNQHDLKTPLNAVINIPSLIMLKEQSLSEQSIKLLSACKSSGYQMLDMINSSLNMYKIENGSYQLKPEKVELIALIKQVLIELGSCTVQCPILLNNTQIKESNKVEVFAEKLLCYSLFSNLIKNALEASDFNECIKINITYSSSTKYCEIILVNQGSVPVEIRGRFFDKFVTQNKKTGTGFGTYSAKLCAEIQNGSISLDTTTENQTRITVKLPTWETTETKL